MLLYALTELLRAEYVTKEVDGEHPHRLEISLLLWPEELVGNFCHAIAPKVPVGNKHVCLGVYQFLVTFGEDRFLKNWLTRIQSCWSPLFMLEICYDSEILFVVHNTVFGEFVLRNFIFINFRLLLITFYICLWAVRDLILLIGLIWNQFVCWGSHLVSLFFTSPSSHMSIAQGAILVTIS